MAKGIRAYNLYPKLVGSMEKWMTHFDRIQQMNFDWIYFNPFNYPGFSGSDYAIKNHYHYHPLYVTGELDFEQPERNVAAGNKLLKKVCKEAQNRGMNVMMDLVINHTAFDSPLSQEHPEWYVRDHNGNLKHPGAMDGPNWIEWKDLAKIDNAHSCDRENLWRYWLDMMLFYADLGIRGFRCDAAYHVPSDLWRFLIPQIRQKYPDALFLGETLGCSPHQVFEIAEAGFDLISNSFKWWNLRDQWFLDQNREYCRRAPSITFPENHDTIRYAYEVGGNQHLAVMKYALGAYICSSISTTIGFEYGFQRQLHVVHTDPSWWEPIRYDISSEIAAINKIKSEYDVLQEDNYIEILHLNDGRLFGFTKESQNGREKIMVLVNPEDHEAHTVCLSNVDGIMGSQDVRDISHARRLDTVPAHLEYHLQPGEVKLLYVNR
ncbi:alpha-amylase [candidate division KSB3 bacterium]|uniref:Alpha-amylase n=1 Tax=candidate division KSB3 bacterium TaxID=2044937 RepID=A0A2G6KB23_9BACT|nr:MAG: alpha-amylase [candidate division KSB3 bacterium]